MPRDSRLGACLTNWDVSCGMPDFGTMNQLVDVQELSVLRMYSTEIDYRA